MPLTAGSRLGPYEILSPIGAGGMGEVYKARDTRLDRDVAIKVLPETLAADAERIARFEREAKTLAALNHPNIAQIYGVQDTDGVRALVMELVDGPTLADRIAQGPVPIDEVLPIAKQIAEGLEAAHEVSVIHRDLKPANIKLRPDGTVKILDFGLAKVLEPVGGIPAALSLSPTITTPAMTQVGVILGTAAYMSPEQARGKAVDRRADIWAFGCVLFEMIAGRQTFDVGDTVSDAVAAILKTDPDWSRLPSDIPANIRKLLRQCLQKDPQKRLPHIGVARLEIDEGPAEPAHPHVAPIAAPTATKPLGRRALPGLAASIVVGLLAATAAWVLKPSRSAEPVSRFAINISEAQALTTTTRHMLAVSPDGTEIAYAAADSRLYLRRMSELEARAIGSETAVPAPYDPVFSPDGRYIAYWTGSDQTIKKIAVGGGAPVTVCPARLSFGLSWGTDGITFGQGEQGILRVRDVGGKPEALVRVNSGELAASPQVLPDGQTIIFTLAKGTRNLTAGTRQWDTAQIVAQSLKTGERKVLLEGGSDARYLPTGHLVYALGGVLYAIPFNARRLEVTGGPVPVVEGVRRSTGAFTAAAQFDVSATGSLVYAPGPTSTISNQVDIALIDPASGASVPLKLQPNSFEHPRVSPNGRQITFGTDDGKEAVVWVYDLSGTSAPRRLVSGGRNKFPIWSGDGERIVFQSDREGDLGIWWQRADFTGVPERLTKADQGASHIPESWLPRGDQFLFSVTKGAVTLSTFSVKERQAKPFDSVQSRVPTNAVFSPDGHWVAYTSGEGTLLGAVYVQPFPPAGTPYRISPGQGLQPLWSPDGKELFFNPAPGQYVKATIATSPTFVFGNPVEVPRPFLSGGPTSHRNNDMTPDGKILGIVSPEAGSTRNNASFQFQVVLNWFNELKQRVPTK